MIVELHLQVVLVDEVVVATAQQHKIDVVGGPAMAPVAHVMGVAVADLAIAAGEAAATIAGGDLREQLAWHGVDRKSVV